MASHRRVSFKTIGCRLNQAETAQMAAGFAAAGYWIVPFEQTADVCVIHTCAITQRAERSVVWTARSLRKANPDCYIILAGCAVEVNGTALLERTGANLLAGQADKFALPARLQPSATLPTDSVTPLHTTKRAAVKVQDGCDFHCAYCIVPQARGPHQSRPIEEVLAEIRGLVERGHREIVLTGANLGCYRDGTCGLVDLIKRVETISGVERIRLSSIELSTVERDVIDYMAFSARLCRFLHLPLQSGDDDILHAMGRRYTSAEYEAVATYAVTQVPQLGLGTDIIVGFPGETDAAFENTRSMLGRIPFSNIHVFPYSSRPGTPAAALPHHVTEHVKKERVAELNRVSEAARCRFAAGFVGHEVSVLLEKVNEAGTRGQGWTGEYLDGIVSGRNLHTNQIVSATVTKVDGHKLHLCATREAAPI